MDGEVPRPADAPIAVLQAPLAAALPRPHARGPGERWGGAAACFAWAFRGLRLGPPPASCQPGAARVAGAAFLSGAAVFVVVVAAGAAGASGLWAGAGSPRHSASSRRMVLITFSSDAICRCGKAIIACSAVGGGGGGRLGSPAAPFPPLGAGSAAHRPLVDGRGLSACRERSQ